MSQHDPTDLQALERARDEAARAARIAQDQEAKDVRWLMSSKNGRRIVWRLLERSGVFRLSFNTNAMAMAFAEGNRNFGVAMLEQVYQVCPELFPQMQAENAQQQKDDPKHDD